MLKEICEQPRRAEYAAGAVAGVRGTARLNGLNLTTEQCNQIQHIVIVACGTSWHAGLVASHLEELACIPWRGVRVEYRYRRQVRLPGL